MGRELLRTFGWLAVVLVAAAGALAGLDAVPAWVNGESRDVRVVASLEDAERAVHARLVLPGYFPDTIAWPAEKIRVLRGKPASVALTFAVRSRREPHLVLAQTIGPGALPDRIMPSAGALDDSPITDSRTGRFVPALTDLVKRILAAPLNALVTTELSDIGAHCDQSVFKYSTRSAFCRSVRFNPK